MLIHTGAATFGTSTSGICFWCMLPTRSLLGFCLNTVSTILPPTFELATRTPSWYTHVDEYVEMVPAVVFAERSSRYAVQAAMAFAIPLAVDPEGRKRLKQVESSGRGKSEIGEVDSEYCSVQRCIYCWRTSLRYANVAQHAHATAGTMSADSAGHFYPPVLPSNSRLPALPQHRILSVISRVSTFPRSLWVCKAEARLDVVNGLGQTTIHAEKWQ